MGYSGNLYAQATEVITSQGDLRRGDSSGNPERLAIGSSGKVLQSNGTTESWETPAGGGGKAFFTVFNDNQAGQVSTYYGCNCTEIEVTTEVGMSSEINTALTCTRSVVHLGANSKGATQTYAFRDDSSDIAAVAVSSTATGFFDSGAVSEAIASGSLINFAGHFTISGSVDIRGWIVEFDT